MAALPAHHGHWWRCRALRRKWASHGAPAGRRFPPRNLADTAFVRRRIRLGPSLRHQQFEFQGQFIRHHGFGRDGSASLAEEFALPAQARRLAASARSAPARCQTLCASPKWLPSASPRMRRSRRKQPTNEKSPQALRDIGWAQERGNSWKNRLKTGTGALRPSIGALPRGCTDGRETAASAHESCRPHVQLCIPRERSPTRPITRPVWSRSQF